MTFYQQSDFEGASPIPGANPEGYMLGPDDGSRIWFDGALITFKAKGLDTDHIMSYFECDAPYGWQAPVHRHANESEFFHITEGVWEVFVKDTVYDVRPGCVVWIPPATPHSIFISSKSGGRASCYLTPGGFEQFFEEVGEPATQPSRPTHDLPRPTVDKLTEMGARFGWEFVEPQPRRLQR